MPYKATRQYLRTLQVSRLYQLRPFGFARQNTPDVLDNLIMDIPFIYGNVQILMKRKLLHHFRL